MDLMFVTSGISPTKAWIMEVLDLFSVPSVMHTIKIKSITREIVPSCSIYSPSTSFYCAVMEMDDLVDIRPFFSNRNKPSWFLSLTPFLHLSL